MAVGNSLDPRLLDVVPCLWRRSRHALRLLRLRAGLPIILGAASGSRPPPLLMTFPRGWCRLWRGDVSGNCRRRRRYGLSTVTTHMGALIGKLLAKDRAPVVASIAKTAIAPLSWLPTSR